jgi:hypothetical protein
VDRIRIYPRHSDGGRYGSLAHPGYRRPGAARVPCRKPFTDFVIYADGQTALCNHDWDRKEADSLGSVRSLSIAAIWNGDGYWQVRQRHLAHDWLALNPCGHCDHWQALEEGEAGLIGSLIEASQG